MKTIVFLTLLPTLACGSVSLYLGQDCEGESTTVSRYVSNFKNLTYSCEQNYAIGEHVDIPVWGTCNFNDKVSSVYISSGESVTIYKHSEARGAYEELDRDGCHNLEDLDNEGSSIVIR